MSTLTVYATKDASAVKNAAQTAFDGWSGNDNHHPVGRWGATFVSNGNTYDWKARSFVYFPISFTGITSITSASMFLMQRSGGHTDPVSSKTISITAYRMTRDWGEAPSSGESAWVNNPHSGYKWTTRAEQSTNGVANWVTEGASTKSYLFSSVGNNGWVEFDITDIVTAWWNHSKGVRTDAPNYGVILVNSEEVSRDWGVDFYAREYGSPRVPYITIDYNTNTAPSVVPEDTRSPNGSVGSPTVVNTLTPTFIGFLDDIDAGDYITKYGIIVRRASDTKVYWDTGGVNVSGRPSSFNVLYGSTSGFTLLPLEGNTVYKWTCNVMDSGGAWCPWSQYDYFKTNTPPNPPTVSLLESPTTDVTTLTPSVVVTHNDPDPGDTLQYGYQVVVEKVGSSQVWDSGLITLDSGERATTKTIPIPTLTDPDGGTPWGLQYRVRAKTVDSNGAWGTFSSWLTFTLRKTGVPISLAPSSNEVTPTRLPTFTGSRASDADTIVSYEIVLYEDDNTTQVWPSGTLTAGISSGAVFDKLYPEAELTQGSYYKWKARVTGSVGGTSEWSELQRFRVPSDASVPAPTSPIGAGIQGATYPLSPSLVGSRASTFDRYQVEVYPSTSTTSNLGTAVYAPGTNFSATITGTGPYTFTLAENNVSGLSWGTEYKWRARVSANGGSTWTDWSGLASFTMDTAETPTLYSPSADEWITDSTPTLTIERGGTDIIDQMRVIVYDALGTTELWDSGFVDVTEDGNHRTSVTYAGTTSLTGGYYMWQAQYQKTTNGPIGNLCDKGRFRLNYPPSLPSDLSPVQGAVIEESLTPTFAARFNDNDIVAVGDTPSAWEIIVELNDSPYTNKATITKTSSLSVGVNEYVYRSDLGLGTQDTLSYGTTYRWKTRYKDSKNDWGPYSSYQTFKPAVQPNSSIIAPTDGSNVTSVRPTVSWSYDAQGGSTQSDAIVQIYHVTDTSSSSITLDDLLAGTANEVLSPIATEHSYSADAEYRINTNLVDARVYEIRLIVKNLDDLVDPTPEVVRVKVVLEAPDPIVGLSPTADESRSVILLEWDEVTSFKSGQSFSAYNIYRRLAGTGDYQLIGSSYSVSVNYYNDWYAGHGVAYEYRVTIVTTKSGVGIELESGDDGSNGNIAESQLSSDIWMFVGADRTDAHIQELPVNDGDHQRVIQQEAFEPLGATRKVIIRGFVLGHEGSISMTYINQDTESPEDPQELMNETIKGRRLIDYLVANKGPHILKSPFGDVWDVEFEGPKYKWLTGGHLEVNLNWVETGNTSMVTI